MASLMNNVSRGSADTDMEDEEGGGSRGDIFFPPPPPSPAVPKGNNKDSMSAELFSPTQGKKIVKKTGLNKGTPAAKKASAIPKGGVTETKGPEVSHTVLDDGEPLERGRLGKKAYGARKAKATEFKPKISTAPGFKSSKQPSSPFKSKRAKAMGGGKKAGVSPYFKVGNWSGDHSHTGAENSGSNEPQVVNEDHYEHYNFGAAPVKQTIEAIPSWQAPPLADQSEKEVDVVSTYMKTGGVSKKRRRKCIDVGMKGTKRRQRFLITLIVVVSAAIIVIACIGTGSYALARGLRSSATTQSPTVIT